MESYHHWDRRIANLAREWYEAAEGQPKVLPRGTEAYTLEKLLSAIRTEKVEIKTLETMKEIANAREVLANVEVAE